jgi:hypothetical protein
VVAEVEILIDLEHHLQLFVFLSRVLHGLVQIQVLCHILFVKVERRLEVGFLEWDLLRLVGRETGINKNLSNWFLRNLLEGVWVER